MSNADLWDAVADEYDGMYLSGEALAEDQIVFDLLKQRGAQRGSLIDFGCGTGLALEHLTLPEGERYLGVDASENMLDQARLKFADSIGQGVDFVCADLASQGLIKYAQPGTFDFAISLFGSPSCIGVDGHSLDQMLSALRRGGQFLMMFASWRYPWRRRTMKGEFLSSLALHTPSTVTSLFENASTPLTYRVWGFNAFAEWLPGFLALPYLRAEARLTERRPWLAYWVMAEGTVE